jgi:hypothetical protein
MAEDWSLAACETLASSRLRGLGDRWLHARSVGRKVRLLGGVLGPGNAVGAAAWLHDVGYAPELRRTGCHPIDGARFLRDEGAPGAVVDLVAKHSGAKFEAEERGLTAELAEFGEPSEADLDLLTLLDMTTGPTGEYVGEDERVAEILNRYEPSHAVHRAVTRSRADLLEACRRARARLGLADVGGAPALGEVLDA